jgi:hypothetical protein
MHKALLFFIAATIVVVLALAKPMEGFTNLMGIDWTSKNAGTPAALYTKLPIEQPKVVDEAELGVGNIQPAPPAASTLPSAPAPQRSKETPNPYRDPSTEPAKYIRLLGVKEDLQAFFGFQAQMLESRSDPAIQIPLTRARADMGELIDVQSVMERNPGLPSRINSKQLDDIQSNLRYLRDILHDLESSGAIQPQTTEGFADVNAAPATTDKRATLKQLQDFQIRVVVEIKRMEASGTSDPVVVGRINTLNRIKADVDQVIEQLQNKTLTPDTVPIFASDIEKAFPLLARPDAPLPQVLKKADLPPAVANLFPGGLSPRDTEQMQQINNIMKGYMKNLFEGASWGLNLNVKYDNPNIAKLNAKVAEKQAEVKKQEAAQQGGYPISTGLPGVQGAVHFESPDIKSVMGKQPSPLGKKDETERGYESGIPGVSASRIFPDPKSGHLDWKQRSQEIKEQIRRRGLNPQDFGALPDNAVVGDNFSWRGYANMICMRLNTTTDPGLATTCGCPPQNWSGWKD